MPGEEEVAQPSDNQVLSEAGDEAFKALNPEPEAPAKSAEPAPGAKPDVKSDPDKVAGADEIDEQTKADIKAGKLIPHHRFKEMQEQVEAFKAFGTPAELRTALARLGELEKLAPAAKKEAIEELSEDDKVQREYLLKLMPELKNLPQTKAELDKLKEEHEARQTETKKQEEQRTQKLFTKAHTMVTDLCEKNGLSSTNKIVLQIHSGAVRDLLNADEGLSERFYRDGDLSAVTEAFDRYYKEVFSGFQMKKEADLLKAKTQQTKLPKPPISGKPPEHKEKPASDMDWNELGDRAMEALG